MNKQRFIVLVLGSWVLASPAWVLAQQDQQSVVEAAKKAQAEKKTAPKAKMVIDDDNVYTLKGIINVVGQEPALPEDQTKAAAAGEKTPKPPAESAPAKDENYWRQKFADANKKLADNQRELDVLQRERNLKQQQFYTDPNASLKQEYSRQDLNDAKAKIDDMTAKVAQDKQDIADLEDQLRQAGGNPGWASGPPQPQQ
jgi:chromosome segregation ATPase